jgi:molecular chaperone DnaJ
MFGDFFGAASPDSPQRGADIRANVELELREAVFGTKKDVQVSHVIPCEPCKGTGAKGGERAPCPQCKGSGQVANARGAFILSTACPRCRGQGTLVLEPCPECDGRAERIVVKTVKITIPAGVDDGQTLRIAGKGQPGVNGGASGHLYVTVQVPEDEQFQRDGADLVHELLLPFTDAALGTEIEVPTIDGEPRRVKVPSGSQPGDAITVKGLGVPRLDGRGRGDLLVLLNITVPTKLSAKAKKILRELADELEPRKAKGDGEGSGEGGGDQGGGGKSRRSGGKRASSSHE